MPLRLAVRSLLRRPGYTLLAVGALALGVAGTTAVFGLVHNVLVEGLPFDDPDRLVTPDVRSPQGFLISISIPNYRDWGERNRVLESYGASAGWTFIRPAAEGAEVLSTRVVLGDFFETLGLRAEHGRVFGAEESDRGAEPIAVLGHAFWQREYGGDPSVIGGSLATDAFTATIVGVLPPGIGYPSPEVEAYVPMGVLGDDVSWEDRHSSFGTRMLGRLSPGVTLGTAQADLDRVAREVAELEGRQVATPELRSLADLFLGDVRRGLWLLMGAVGLLLLIACANVANLALARGEGRSRELAVRTALGAGRRRIVALLLGEAALVAVAGGALGVGLSAATIRALPRVLPLDIPSLVAERVALDGPVLFFALAVTTVSALLFGLVPALRLAWRDATAGPDGIAPLRDGTRTSSSRDARRLRDGLVVTQVALSLILLVAAGLLTRSLARLGEVDAGFDAGSVVGARLQSPDGMFETPDARWSFYEALKTRLDASPDVEVAASTLLLPLTGRSWERAIAPEGASLEINDMESVLYNVVGPGYFRALGVPILRGRAFDASDTGDGRPVAIIDETMAERFWPGESPIGKRVSFERHDPSAPVEWLEVVGVAANVRHYELRSPSRIQVWVPMRQISFGAGLSVAVRARPGAEAAATRLLREAVADLAPGTALRDLRPLADVVDDRLGPDRSLGALTALFAAFAVVLAALGIFGVLSIAVARRRRELGIRMAVGATPLGVVRLVARYGLALGGIGIGAGLVGALAASRLLGSVLFEVAPFDPLVYGTVALGMLGIAVAAAAGPAIRAAAVDPARVLREE
jgi:putative ABC transport system permease protein